MSLSDYPDPALRPITDDERARALATLRRYDALDLADLLGLTQGE